MASVEVSDVAGPHVVEQEVALGMDDLAAQRRATTS
jgi:hypothetical protein